MLKIKCKQVLIWAYKYNFLLLFHAIITDYSLLKIIKLTVMCITLIVSGRFYSSVDLCFLIFYRFAFQNVSGKPQINHTNLFPRVALFL
jgi:hypothetical protein